MIELWFEPHATTLDNEAKQASGWNDVALSGRGVQQAAELIERCRDRNLDAIFCSDLQRAVLTAVPTANALHLPIYADMRLRECDYGDMTGQSSSIIEQERPNRIDVPFPGGESYGQCMERIGWFFNDLRKSYDGKTVLVVGHRATHYGIEHTALGKSLEQCVTEHWQWQPGWKYEVNW